VFGFETFKTGDYAIFAQIVLIGGVEFLGVFFGDGFRRFVVHGLPEQFAESALLGLLLMVLHFEQRFYFFMVHGLSQTQSIVRQFFEILELFGKFVGLG
jgi:hypothetical protein